MPSVIVRKLDNMVVDASGGDTLNYDPATHDNLHPPVNPIAAGDDPKKYFRDGGGNIIKRATGDLVKEFSDEKDTALLLRVTVIEADPGLLPATKTALRQIVQILRNL